MRKFIVTILALVILAGCSRQFNIEPDAVIDMSKGILMASVTKGSMTPSTNAHISYVRVEETGTMSLSARGFELTNDYPRRVDKWGQLVAIESEPGEYQLTNWQLVASTGYGVVTISPKRDPSPLSFTINPGEITYIGNLHVKTTEFSKGVLVGNHIATGASIRISNELEADKRILYRKYPNISRWPINIEVPDDSDWQLPNNHVESY